MTRPPFAPIIDGLPATIPFVGPEAIERRSGRRFVARLGANESGFGPSPKVIEAIGKAASGVWTYGDPENYDLKSALAERLDTPFDTIAIGEGIDGLQGLICRMFLAPGDRLVTSLGAYPTFNYHAATQGARIDAVPYRDDREDLDALIDAVRAQPTRIVYLANPDNPMGTWWDAAAIEAFARAIPAQTLIVLDEAYGETAPQGTLPPIGFALPNLLRLRTFSKAYGLAGLRVGYCIGAPEIIAGFDRIRNHFGVNKIGQIAALTALSYTDHLAWAIAQVEAARNTIIAASAELGLKTIASATNFVAIDCGRDGRFALAVLEGLAERAIFVRKPMAPVLDRCIRMSVGPASELDRALKGLAQTLQVLEKA